MSARSRKLSGLALVLVLGVAGAAGVALWQGRAPGLARPIREISLERQSVHALAFAPAGDLLVVGDADATVHLFSVASGREIAATKVRARGAPIAALAFVPAGDVLFASDADFDRSVWALAVPSLRVLAKLEPDAQGPFVASDGDGQRLATANTDQIMLWNVASREPGRTIAVPGFEHVASLGFASGGVLAIGGHKGHARFWSVRAGEDLGAIDAPKLLGGSAPVQLATTPDADVAGVLCEKHLGLWSIPKRALEASVELPSVGLGVFLAPTGDRLAVTSFSTNGIQLYSVPELKLVDEIKPVSGALPVVAVAFSSSGELLAATSEGRVRVYRLQRR